VRHGAPTGRATGLKTRRLWVRLPPVSLRGTTAFGRAVVRQAGCNPAAPHGALWVRFPPGALLVIRLVGLVEMIPECQPGDRGSIPRRAADGDGPFVQRTGRLVLNQKTGVRFPHGSLGERVRDEGGGMNSDCGRASVMIHPSSLRNGDVDQRQESPRSERGQCGFESHRHHWKCLADGRAPGRVS
jgi:hypothetical protein